MAVPAQGAELHRYLDGKVEGAAIYINGAAEEIGAERIVRSICRRWGEENAIKELLHKHLINFTPGSSEQAM